MAAGPAIPALGVAAFALAMLAPGTGAAAQGRGAADAGAEIVRRWCSECHAAGAAGRAGDVGPTFAEIARSRSPDYIRGFLANPHVRGSMPPFDLARPHVEDIIAYLQTLK